MEKLLLLGVSLVVAFLSILSEASAKTNKPSNPAKQKLLDEAWSAFKRQFNKSYKANDEANRMDIFVDNLEMIGIYNFLESVGLRSFTMSVNQLADLTTDEFSATMNGFKPPESSNETRKAAETHYRKARQSGGVPASMDWKTAGAVTPVKSQSTCGSCWSISATGAVEAQNFISTGTLVSLSEQNLIDCTGGPPYNTGGCTGGFMKPAFQYIMDNGGIDSESSYPYKGVVGSCSYDNANNAAAISSFVSLPSGDETALQRAVGLVGPVSVAIDGSLQTFQFYNGGLYNDPGCSTTPNHAVLVVGYGTTTDGQTVWIIKNSWSVNWGHRGHFYLPFQQNNKCGVATDASYPYPPV